MNRPFEPQLILVVNNNTETRYAAARALQSAGFATLEAASGAEELRLIGSNVALVIVDINLPDMDGFSVCKAIRAREDVARVPVIHLSSSFTSDVDRAHGYNSGADGYLTHPVDPRVLIATVNAFLRSRMADEAARLSEDKFCRVFRYAADGIAILDSGFSFVDANP